MTRSSSVMDRRQRGRRLNRLVAALGRQILGERSLAAGRVDLTSRRLLYIPCGAGAGSGGRDGMIVGIAFHILAAVIWVGGMFFALMVLRPSTGPLEPAVRLALWHRVFSRFFAWVWL